MSIINVGINGLGRIGKSCFLQLLEDNNVVIGAININKLSIDTFEEYINNDTIHGKKNYKVTKLTNDVIKVNNKTIKIYNERDPNNIDWRKYNVEYLLETTGAFLTQEKASHHNAKYILMSAPPKDLGITPIYCYGVNEDKYNGEQIISNASCTTNSIAPFLRLLIKYNIASSNFITIHSATSSQSIVDTANFNKRTNRSIFNNIIPHTTGATDSLKYILPEMDNKIVGTSVRIPVANVSMIDLNVTFENEITKEKILEDIEKLQNNVITLNKQKLVSSDFIGTTHPTIVDYHSTFQVDSKTIKFTLWYDNEWSYSSQMVRMIKVMHEKNKETSIKKIMNVNCTNKIVMVRCDFNCPVNEENKIEDVYRISSALPTLYKILFDKPKKLILMTHFGRPKGEEEKYSTKIFQEVLEDKLKVRVKFLEKGLDFTKEDIKENGVYLMENVRYHDYETSKNPSKKDICIIPDVYCNEAFSASHRDHYSINNIKSKMHCYGVCFIKEIETFDMLLNNKGANIIAVIGGSKVSDKIPMLEKLSQIVNVIYVCGNNLNSLKENEDFFKKISSNKAEIVFASDGFGNISPNDPPKYKSQINNNSDEKIFDIGPKSIKKLSDYIEKSNIVFWNGALGITEHDFYKNSSELLINILNNCKAKVIIGGGDTSGFVNKYPNNYYHVSTGGGASIEYISTGTLKGLKYSK